MSSAPPIQADTVSKTNTSQLLKVNTLIATSITDGIATLTGGTITGLLDPILEQDAATKEFVEGAGLPGGIANSVQYNNNGVFGGSEKFTWDTPVLTIDGIVQDDTGLTINSGTISNVISPVLPNQIANKQYVDSFSTLKTNVNISSDEAVTYTASQMLNATVVRDTLTDTLYYASLVDTTATAAELVAAVDGVIVGNVYPWYVINDKLNANGTDPIGADQFVFSIEPGTGVTFNPSDAFIVPRTYVLDATIIFENVTPGTEAVTININSCSSTNPSIFFAPDSVYGISQYATVTNMPVMVRSNLITPVPTITTIVGVAPFAPLSGTDIKNGFVIANIGGNGDIYFDKADDSINSQIVHINNISANVLTIISNDGIWEIDDPYVLAAGYQAKFALYFDRTVFTVSSGGTGYSQYSSYKAGTVGNYVNIFVTVDPDNDDTILSVLVNSIANATYTSGTILDVFSDTALPGAGGQIVYNTPGLVRPLGYINMS